MQKHTIFLISLFVFLSIAILSFAGISGSKHDLSTGNLSPCIFCHTPHNSRTDAAPLWNLVNRNVTYQMYSSPTMSNPSPSVPSGMSLACLSCHDGAGTTGDNQHHIMTINKPEYMNSANCEKCHPGSRPDPQRPMYSDILLNAIKTDLRNDHPISVPYPTPSQDPDFFTPPDYQKGWPDVPFYDGKIECGSCHDPHNPTNTPFLRKSNAGSALCLTCHNK